jgi:hypothetical protein
MMSISAQFTEIDVYFYYNVEKVFQRDGATIIPTHPQD